MNLIALVFKEIGRRKAGFALACGAVALAAAGVVYTETVSSAFVDAMRRVTKKMGHNILVAPKGVDANAFWAGESGVAEMDQDMVRKLAESTVSAEHFLGKLQVRIEIDGNRAVLTGTMREIGSVLKAKPWKKAMSSETPRGKCFLGSAIAARLGEKGQVGRTLTLDGPGFTGRDFEIVKVLKTKSPGEDSRIFVNIADAQEMLGKPGRIHAIDALGCMCPIDRSGPSYLQEIERQIEELLPGTDATTYTSIASARMEARLGAGLTRWLTVGALSVLALLVMGFYLLSDVRERREELGMFLAVGFGPGKLVVMYMAKLCLIAVVGAALGFALGTVGALLTPVELLSKVAIRIAVVWPTALWSLVGALGVGLVAGILPTIAAARTDPAEVLRKG